MEWESGWWNNPNSTSAWRWLSSLISCFDPKQWMRICRVKYWHGNWIVVLIEIQSALSASSKLYASRRFHKMDVCEFSCDWKILVCEIWPGAERREGVSWSRALGSGQCVGGATGTDRHFMHSLQSQNCVYLKVNAFLCISFFTHCGSVTHSAAQTQAHVSEISWQGCALGLVICIPPHPMTCPNQDTKP